MEHRDLIKDQIEQLGKVLGKILSDFLGLKTIGQVSQGIEIANKQLKSRLDIDIDKLLSIDNNMFKEYFEKRMMPPEHLEILSKYLKEVGETKITTNINDAKVYLNKSLELLVLIDDITKTMSFERMNQKLQIENMLQQ